MGAAAALLLLSLAAVQAEVLLVYSVQRHGARNVLPKSATLKESDAAGGPTLLPQGQRQAYNVGLGYRSRYLNATACTGGLTCLNTPVAEPGPEYGVVGTPDGTFNNFNTLFRSSSLDRTIMTARSFLDAVFPPINQPTNASYLPDGQQVVPVYSLPDDGDALIRGYTDCPAYDSRLLEWYNSEEFKAKEAETEAFRNSIAAAAPGLNTNLTNWWNVFDGFNVYRNYNVGTPMPPIDNETFAQMQSLAYWLETAKMRSNLTGTLLGSPLLGDLLSYIDAAVAALSANLVSPIYYKIVHVSAHYNTQLGVLGALEIDQDPAAADVAWLKKIPSLAALMAFELHGDTSTSQTPQDMAVRLVMQDGASASYTTIPLSCATPGDSAEALAGPGACTLEAFKALVEPRATSSIGDWCDACQNTDWTACQLQAATKALDESAGATSATTTDSSSSSASNSSSGLSGGAVAGIAVGCAVAGATLAGAVFALYSRKVQRRQDAAKLAGLHQAGSLPQTV